MAALVLGACRCSSKSGGGCGGNRGSMQGNSCFSAAAAAATAATAVLLLRLLLLLLLAWLRPAAAATCKHTHRPHVHATAVKHTWLQHHNCLVILSMYLYVLLLLLLYILPHHAASLTPVVAPPPPSQHLAGTPHSGLLGARAAAQPLGGEHQALRLSVAAGGEGWWRWGERCGIERVYVCMCVQRTGQTHRHRCSHVRSSISQQQQQYQQQYPQQ
jgi:hypothetical protein